MKLECEVVQDIYVLYQDNDLQPKVKKAVVDHLDICETCSHVYQEGTGFFDYLPPEEVDLKSSQKVDNKILLKLKLRRMRIFLLFIISVFIIYSYFQYVEDRKSLLYELSSAEQTLNTMRFQVEAARSERGPYSSISSLLSDFNEKTVRFKRHLNMLEKKRMESHPYQSNLSLSMNPFVYLLHQRYINENWTNRDEQALTQMYNYIEDYMKLLTEERLKLNNLNEFNIRALLVPIDVEEMLTLNQHIDYLAYTYSSFQKFPDEINILPKDEVISIIKELFDKPDANVNLHFNLSDEVIKGYGEYTFDLETQNSSYYGDIDAYTGVLRSFNGHNILTEGELISKQKALTNIEAFLKRFMGAQMEYNIEDLGLNYHYTSNVDNQLYSYHVTPMYHGYSLNTTLRYYIDARSGKLISMKNVEGHTYKPHLLYSEPQVKVNVDDGIEKLHEMDPDKTITYEKTLYIPSILTHQHELVHLFKINNQKHYMNARTGKEDIPY